MRKPLFSKKPSCLLATTLIFSVLFTAIVYACSGLASMQMSSLHASHASMDGGMGDKSPCGERKQDICQSVRQLMLSIQTSPSQAEGSLRGLNIPLALPHDIPMPSEISTASAQLTKALYPLFKIPLTYSYLVLRI